MTLTGGAVKIVGMRIRHLSMTDKRKKVAEKGASILQTLQWVYTSSRSVAHFDLDNSSPVSVSWTLSVSKRACSSGPFYFSQDVF